MLRKGQLKMEDDMMKFADTVNEKYFEDQEKRLRAENIIRTYKIHEALKTISIVAIIRVAITIILLVGFVKLVESPIYSDDFLKRYIFVAMLYFFPAALIWGKVYEWSKIFYNNSIDRIRARAHHMMKSYKLNTTAEE